MSECIYCGGHAAGEALQRIRDIDEIIEHKDDDRWAHASCHWEHETDRAHQRIAAQDARIGQLEQRLKDRDEVVSILIVGFAKISDFVSISDGEVKWSDEESRQFRQHIKVMDTLLAKYERMMRIAVPDSAPNSQYKG